MTDTFDRLKTALADRYAIQEELGAGGMATVYLAEDLKHNRNVAVKVLRPELAAILGAERFLKEIEVTANLQHPHILPLFDSGEADSFLYYVMPHVEGESLRDRLNRDKQLPVEEAVRIAEMVASALESAHRHDIVHRDIKPENILLHEGQALVADFGIALAVSAAAGARMTETGLSLGTPHYMSPEQATADRDITGRSDIYSLACVTYEMLAGDPPYLGNTAQAVIARIISDAPRPVRELRATVPVHVELALHKALEKLPADRFATAKEFADALTNPAFTLPTAVGVITATRARDRWKQRLAIPFAILAAVFLVTTLWGWLRPDPPKPVARYGIALPEHQALMGRLALSPDGSAWAYVGPGEQETQLWIKRRADHQATPLAGTEGAIAPFFSPDGAWVGFMADGEVKKIPLGGGATITLADSARMLGASYGGAWLDDGSIVFVDEAYNLLGVPDRGGPPQRVVAADDDSVLSFATHVTPLPDGRGVLFTRCSGGCAQSAVFTLDLRTGTTRSLIEGGLGAWYVPTGHVLYGNGSGNVFAVPFDPGRLELTGPAFPVLEGVAGLRYPTLALSGSGALLYVEGAGGRQAIRQLTWVERDGAARAIDPSWTGLFESVALSPDGTRLAVTVGGERETDLWIKQLDRGPASLLTFTDGLNRRPTWTRDGLSVTFISNRGDNRDLYVKRADGVGSAEVVLDLAVNVDEGFWSPDGDWLIYRAGITGEERDIFAWRPGPDSATVPVATAPGVDEVAPALSPDGRWLAYVSNETSRQEVWVRPFPDVEAGRWQVSVQGGTEPVWAHSGRELFYKSQGSLMVVDVQTDPTFATLEVRELFSTQGYFPFGLHRSYDVTADDQQFVMIMFAGFGERGDLILVENFFEELKAKVAN